MLLADVFPELKYQADNLSRELAGLVTLENGIREQRDQEQRETEGLAAERSKVDRLLEEKKAKLAQGEVELAQIRQNAVGLAAEVTSLNELIERLDAEIAKVEVAQYDAEIAAERALRDRLQQQALATPANESVVEIKPDQTIIAFASPDRLKPPCRSRLPRAPCGCPLKGGG
jgi:septal ring factor EnvC (AmiA/AmiB activator)